jgi:hypothetical protein
MMDLVFCGPIRYSTRARSREAVTSEVPLLVILKLAIVSKNLKKILVSTRKHYVYGTLFNASAGT